MHPLLPGLALSAALGLAGLLLGQWIPAIGGVTLAILLGAMCGNLGLCPESANEGIRYAGKQVLNVAVVLLGFQVDLSAVAGMGWTTVVGLAALVGTTVLLGYGVGRVFGLSTSLGLLIGVGNAVCGTSAIAAAAPVVADEETEGEVGVAVGVINALGTVGILAVPALAVALGFGADEAALLIGGSLQAVGHVVAAGFAVGEEVGELATAVKMSRVAMLLPVVLVLGAVRARKQDGLSIPGFLIGFVVAAGLAATGLIPAEVLAVGKTVTKVLLAVAMAAIGSKIRLADLRDNGTKALVAGLTVFLLQVGLLAGVLWVM